MAKGWQQVQQLLAALVACHKNIFKSRDLFLEALPAAESRAGSRANCNRFASPDCGRLFVWCCPDSFQPRTFSYTVIQLRAGFSAMCKGTAVPGLHAPVRAVSLKPIVARVAQRRLVPITPYLQLPCALD